MFDSLLYFNLLFQFFKFFVSRNELFQLVDDRLSIVKFTSVD